VRQLLTAWWRLKCWMKDGTLPKIWRHLLADLDAAGQIDWSKCALDGSCDKVGRSRAETPSKRHGIVDGQGIPLGLHLESASVHELKAALPTLASLRVPSVS
jgi:transposase